MCMQQDATRILTSPCEGQMRIPVEVVNVHHGSQQ